MNQKPEKEGVATKNICDKDSNSSNNNNSHIKNVMPFSLFRVFPLIFGYETKDVWCWLKTANADANVPATNGLSLKL